MRILLTNDDGIHAPGMRALINAVRDLGEVVVAAPDGERSASGRAVTMSGPIRAERIDLEGAALAFIVSGTPADAVKLAQHQFLSELPDLLISGINLGLNTGLAAIYSGTVSAAAEGAALGVPSLAVSLEYAQPPPWRTAMAVVRELAPRLLEQPLPLGTLLNVNVPARETGQLLGMKVVRCCPSRFIEVFHHHRDPQGRNYYWMGGGIELLDHRPDTDCAAVHEGCVALTPLRYELTDFASLPQLEALTTSPVLTQPAG